MRKQLSLWTLPVLEHNRSLFFLFVSSHQVSRLFVFCQGKHHNTTFCFPNLLFPSLRWNCTKEVTRSTHPLRTDLMVIPYPGTEVHRFGCDNLSAVDRNTMIDVETYRARIGCFCHRKPPNRERTFLSNLDLVYHLNKLVSELIPRWQQCPSFPKMRIMLAFRFVLSVVVSLLSHSPRFLSHRKTTKAALQYIHFWF